jgi:UDP-glucose 4-epimerase
MPDLSGSTVLVTGADGFIGSHLVERLHGAGTSVRALCFYNSNGSRGWLDDVSEEIASDVDVRFGDIRDMAFVQDLVAGVDIVFHLAALISVAYSYEAPLSFVDTNVGGTVNILEGVKRAGPQTKLIHTSTSEVYGTPDRVPITTDHPLKGQSPYSASKIAADKMCEAYARSFDLPVTIVRPFNTFGPRQSARAVIPAILVQLLAGRKEIRLGNLYPSRDFTYVDDTVLGFIKAAEATLDPGELVQLGTGRAISVGDLFELCKELTGSDAKVIEDAERSRKPSTEVDILLSDISRASELLGWSPEVTLEDGIRRTISWLQPRVGAISPDTYHR